MLTVFIQVFRNLAEPEPNRILAKGSNLCPLWKMTPQTTIDEQTYFHDFLWHFEIQFRESCLQDVQPPKNVSPVVRGTLGYHQPGLEPRPGHGLALGPRALGISRAPSGTQLEIQKIDGQQTFSSIVFWGGHSRGFKRFQHRQSARNNIPDRSG